MERKATIILVIVLVCCGIGASAYHRDGYEREGYNGRNVASAVTNDMNNFATEESARYGNTKSKVLYNIIIIIYNTAYNNNDKKENAFYYYNKTITKHSITIIIPDTIVVKTIGRITTRKGLVLNSKKQHNPHDSEVILQTTYSNGNLQTFQFCSKSSNSKIGLLASYDLGYVLKKSILDHTTRSFYELHYVRVPGPIVDGDTFPSWATADMLFQLTNKYGCWRLISMDWFNWGLALYNGKDEVDNRIIIFPIHNGYVASQCFKLEAYP